MSRMSSLLRQSIAVASLESENVAIDGQPENPYDHIETTPADRYGQTAVEIASAELSARATVSIEEAELSGDLAEAEADLDAGVDAVDELGAAQDTLERTADLAESTLDEGGMTPQTAEAVAITVDSVREKLGVDEDPIPATESFGGSGTRYSATVAALESISELATKTGNAIKTAWARIKQFLANIFSKIVEFFFSLAARNKSLRKKIDAAKKLNTRNSGDVNIGDLADRIAIGGDVSIASLDKMMDVAASASKWDDAALTALKTEHAGLLACAAGTASSLNGEFPVPTGAFKASGDGSFKTDVLPGDVTFAIVPNERAEKREAGWGSVTKAEGISGKAGAAKDAVSISIANLLVRFAKQYRVQKDAPKAADGTKMTQRAKDYGNKVSRGDTAKQLSVDECEKVYASVEAFNKIRKDAELKKTAKGLEFKDVKFSDALSKEQQAQVKKLISQFAGRLAVTNQASAKVMAHAVRVCAGFQTYALKSLAQMGKAEKTA